MIHVGIGYDMVMAMRLFEYERIVLIALAIYVVVTLLDRLSDRGLGFGGLLRRAGQQERMLRREAFAVERLDRGLQTLAGPEFADHIWTDTLTIPQVADRIAATAGVELVPNTDGEIRARIRRLGVTVTHIRL